NLAADPLICYDAAPEDLFAAQRLMRSRGEEMIAIYHSHPRSPDPTPSTTDIQLAYYPNAVYLIVGFDKESPLVRAFSISEADQTYTPVNLYVDIEPQA
ncbi:MAG: Mov34/MPN/PAD-1 family protein, partial [Pyrinomonadaceae bacterium]